MSGEPFVTFPWGAQTVAVPAIEVTAILDHAAEGTLPLRPTATARAIAYGGELCAVLDAPDAAARTNYVVLLNADGNLALRVRPPIEVRHGSRGDGGRVHWDDGQSAPVWTRRRLLNDWLARS